MSYIKALKQVNNKQIPPVILLYGLESYFIHNLQHELMKVILEDSSDENLSAYDLEETPIEDIITEAETYPFFSGNKLIIVNNPLFLTAKQKKLPFEHDLNKLEQYINHPVDYSTIVFIAPYDKLDNRKKITKVFNKQAMVVECNPIKDYELDKWIKTLATELRITITPDAYDVFEAELVANLHLIQNELTKLATFVGENGVVTKEIAEDLISQTANSSALRLVDAVIEKNLQKAISIYQDLEKMNEEPIALIALLAFQFRTIFQIKLLKQRGYGQSQMQKQIGAHPYVIKIAAERERRFTIEKLKDIFDRLANADAAIKQGKMEKKLVFELLLYDLIKE
jgi:DNA polymerase-3 subunit delta